MLVLARTLAVLVCRWSIVCRPGLARDGGTQHGGHDRDRGEGERGGDPEREVIAAGERSGAGVSLCEEVRVCALDSVASTASPSAPPTCAVVLTRPEARPASCGSTPDIARFISAGKHMPAPMPSSSIEGITWTK